MLFSQFDTSHLNNVRLKICGVTAEAGKQSVHNTMHVMRHRDVTCMLPRNTHRWHSLAEMSMRSGSISICM